MGAALRPPASAPASNPFDLDDSTAYRRWRAWKLAFQARTVDELCIDVHDPRALHMAERTALLERMVRNNMALYRSPVVDQDPGLPRAVGSQLGLHRLDANWLADEDGISRIAVSGASDGRGGFIPYTDRPIRWHTDGYYHPAERRIRGMILHCVRPARSGGTNALLDPEIAYLRLRDTSPAHVRALMQPDAMTIPARSNDDGVARAAQSGPVFSVDPTDGSLHMRFTARTRSIEWKRDEATRAAVDCLSALLAEDGTGVLRVRLQAGMGLVSNNVLHDRSGFDDDPEQPRLLYRARFLDRIDEDPAGAPWRNG